MGNVSSLWLFVLVCFLQFLHQNYVKPYQRVHNTVLDGILHFPADQVFKPMMSELTQADWNSKPHADAGT
jgi:hypothetical protein